MTDDISIDDFAREVEQRIQMGEEFLAELPDFEMGRRVRHGSAVVAVADIDMNDNEGS